MRRRALALGVLALALAAAGLVADLLPRPWKGAGASSLPDLSGQLARARALSAEPAMKLAPRLSADARFVAFALGEDGRATRIVVQAVDGSSRQFVGQADALRLSPAFFPGAGRIAFWKSSGGDCGIVAYDLARGIEEPLVDCALLPRVRFDISPDGRGLVFTGEPDPAAPAGLWHVDLAGGARRRLTQPAAGMGDDLHPRFSPDGTHVAFFRGRGRERQPWVVAVSRPLGEFAITRHAGSAHGLAWLGAGGPLVVATDWGGRSGLHVVDPASGESRHAGQAGARFPDASPGGDLVFEVGHAADGASRDGIAAASNESAPGAPTGAIDLRIARVK